jgi:hypothetical protein
MSFLGGGDGEGKGDLISAVADEMEIGLGLLL